MIGILVKWKAGPFDLLGWRADVTTNQFRGQPVTADTQTGHLQYAVYSATCALLSYVITHVSIDS